MAESVSEANEVRKFLVSIGVELDVALQFEEEQMTYEAILKASEKQLKEDLNLTKLGHRLSLRAFCENRKKLVVATDKTTAEEESREARKRRLLKELEKKRNIRLKTKEPATPRGEKSVTYKNAKATRKVELAWLHMTENGCKKFVKLKDGGGTRNVDIAKSATKTEIIQIAKKLFLSDGKSTIGPSEQLEVDLLTFDKESISTFHVDDKEVPFTLQSYIDIFKLSKIRLYLSTRIKLDEFDEYSDNSSDTADLDPDISMLDNQQLQSLEPDVPNQEGLIGLSNVQHLTELVKNAYQESLAKDEAKSSVLAEVPTDIEHHNMDDNDSNNLKRVRNERLPKEPDISEPHHVVSVRHLSLGVLTRMFSIDDFAYSIYDWIGSLPESPDHFQLRTYLGNYLSPSDSVKSVNKCMLLMVHSEEPAPFSPSEKEVFLRGFGAHTENSLPGAAIEFSLDPILEHCPHNIMQEDDNEEQSSGDLDHESHYTDENQPATEKTGLNYGRKLTLDVIEIMPDITVVRTNILQTLLDIYKSSEYHDKFFNFIIKDELAQDVDGVKREIFSIFWEEITTHYFDGGNSFVPRVGPDITDDLCKILGRALIHCFLLTGILPIQLSKAFMVAVIVGEESLSDQDFLDAFLEYVLDYEAAVLRKALQEGEIGKIEATTQQKTVEILSPYGIRALPTHNTISSLLIDTARCELVQKVNRAIGKFREGVLEMGSSIIQHASKKDVLELYDNLFPTSEKLLSLIRPEVDGDLTKQQEEVLHHLQRYICAADSETQKRLLRFITGSHYVVAPEIKVIFHSSIGKLPCFVAHTCSCVVDLPVGGYLGFADFKSQLDKILNNPESWKFHLV